MNIINVCNKIITYSFYSLLLLVPLVFAGDTSELFELNKMWFTYGVSAILFTSWGSKIIAERKIHIQRTPLDIPILVFLGAHIISTIFSLDAYTSFWGYYSRFNGGLLSMMCYVFMYYAFVSNLSLKEVYTSLKFLLLSSLITSLWALPSHFGHDPTCLVFRGQFDTNCWTDAFKPTIRTFSTLGQPAWLAAFLAMSLPIAMSFALTATKRNMWLYLSLVGFMYLNLIFTDTRAGFLAFWVGNIIFWLGVFFRHVTRQVITKKLFTRAFIIFMAVFLLATFIFGGPLGTYSKFTLRDTLYKSAQPQQEVSFSGAPAAPQSASKIDTGITNSSKIRLIVWQGAIEAWKNNPIFGTGVETFAFAYYKYKSPEHNLTSEWDYLYNKAHNEYLNYLTTTGIVGLGSYLAIIGYFLFVTLKRLFLQKTDEQHAITMIGLVAGFVTILITNFFGFSVVIMNIMLFLIPIFVFMLGDMLNEKHTITKYFGAHHRKETINGFQWTGISALIIFTLWANIGLLVFRSADVAYALGNNLNKTGNFQQAYEPLNSAVQAINFESVYKDEFAINLAANAANLFNQKNTQEAMQLTKRAIELSDQTVLEHPNNVIYWKNRVRLFYTLAAADPDHQTDYYMEALRAIDNAKELAPVDAKIAYNQGILYGQVGQLDKGIQMLNETIKLRKNYADAYVALGLFYHQAAVDKNGKVVNRDNLQKAIQTYEFINSDITNTLTDVNDSLQQWKKE